MRLKEGRLYDQDSGVILHEGFWHDGKYQTSGPNAVIIETTKK